MHQNTRRIRKRQAALPKITQKFLVEQPGNRRFATIADWPQHRLVALGATLLAQ
jgi:hypothetical protein